MIQIKQENPMQKNSRIFTITCMLSLFSTFSFSQLSIENFVKQETSQIKTINPDSLNFDDLETVGNAIGATRVVFLGEQSHGDAATFMAKARIVKYLHEKKGFDVLAFESDFFSLVKGWEMVENGSQNIDSLLGGNIYGAWTLCAPVRNFFYSYIPNCLKNGTPLIISGFDNQLILANSYMTLFHDLDSVLKHFNLDVTKEINYTTETLPLIKSIYDQMNGSTDSSRFEKRDSILIHIKEQLMPKVGDNGFWLMILDNLISFNMKLKYAKSNFFKSGNYRDIQMAKNLKWLYTQRFPHRKIIVWAHNYHISKYNGHYEESFTNLARTLGDEFTSDSLMNTASYVIGFTSAEGEFGMVRSNKNKVPRPKSNSFENWVNRDYSFSFTDFKKFNADLKNGKSAFFMNGSVKTPNLHTHSFAEWNKIFDGVFFIRKMTPCAN